jgi:hypothetical protein
MSQKLFLELEYLEIVRAVGIPEGIAHHRFHPGRKFEFDRAWLEQKVAVEIEGGVFMNGRHTRPEGYVRDCEKYNLAILDGWKVFRFTPDMLNPNGMAAWFTRRMKERYFNGNTGDVHVGSFRDSAPGDMAGGAVVLDLRED